MKPKLSKHFQTRKPSSIRQAQIIFSKRLDREDVEVINLAIGNISLPMYPAMKKRLNTLSNLHFKEGIVKYTPTVGTDEARAAFLNILLSENIKIDGIECLITDGGSAAMEIMLLGVCGPSSKKPILLLDPTYTNYTEFCNRLSIPFITTKRKLNDKGSFNSLDLKKIEKLIKKEKPAGIIVIPYDNPSGQYLNQDTLIEISKICVNNNIWIISDEAYRSLYFNQVEGECSSIWRISESQVPGISKRRISIESASKVWNACGLRIGALLTDNKGFHESATSEYTANLSANSIGQMIFGALANESIIDLQLWYKKQRKYYSDIMFKVRSNLLNDLPGLIVSKPEAAIYFILDFKKICKENFNAEVFTQFCAEKGKVLIEEKKYTLLLAPMNGFYKNSKHGKTQLRLAVVEPSEKMFMTSKVLKKLYIDFNLSSS